jgi:type IV pilus assembly protein PilC
MVTVVLPQFIKMFDQAGITELPLPTAVLIGLSHFVTNYWYYLIFGILVVVISVRMLIKTENGRLFWDSMKFKLPVSKQIIPRMMVVRFCRTFSTLISSGMPMLQALSIVTNVMNNKAIAVELTETSEDIRKGMSLTQSIRRVTVFPPMLQSMISIGEESGSLESMLEKTSEYFDAELESAIARMVAMIEPVMIIIMAVVVGFIILSVMLPMLQIYNSI